jgi:hypothetical protein
LPVADEDVVEFDPVGWGKSAAERSLGFLGRLRVDIPPAIRDSVDVRVHADAEFAEPRSDDQIRGFPSHAREREQIIDVVGDASLKPAEKVCAERPKAPGFGAVKRHRINCLLDRSRG